ncbi:MAG: xanthine dehydrogenase accessory protein XdhC [Telluria sp.]
MLRHPTDALTAALGQRVPRVLVTVIQVTGAAPREPGARMVVTPYQTFDSVGGGYLELQATRFARALLCDVAAASVRHVERFFTEPEGSPGEEAQVDLAFERIGPETLKSLRQIRRRARSHIDSWRLVSLDTDSDCSVYDQDGVRLSGDGPALLALPDDGRVLRIDADGSRWLMDAFLAPRPHLMLFGAGHVGAAIVRALAPLPCRVTWVDEREEMFPPLLPSNIAPEATDMPEALIAGASAGTTYLVLTHSHALDQRLSEAILKRGDARWFGLIGSHTKRVQFERRLKERGVPAARLASMSCPIGVPGIADKAPAAIAASVTAQLLQVWESANIA